MTRAQAEGKRAAAMFPRDVVKRSNAAMFAMYAGDSDGAMRDAATALKMNPSYAKDYIVLGISKLAKDLPDEAAAEYERLRNLNARGASLAAMAQADMDLYQGRAREAAAVLAPAVEADFTAGLKGTAARKLVLMAEARMVDDRKAAQAALQRALQTSRQDGVLFSAARMLVDLDELGAKTISADLGNMFLPEPQSYGKLIESEIFLKHSNARDALRSAEQAKGLADTWIAHFDLGRAYLAAGQFVEASSEFELCLRRKGETAALFLDEIPTMRFLAPVYYYLGRAQEGLGSAAAKESFATYIALKSKGGQDLLLADAKRRASKL
jgi:eukaryotic-like serine/threonine-protein kinase